MHLDKYLLSDDIEMVQLGVNLFYSENGRDKIPTINNRFVIRTDKRKEGFIVMDLFAVTDLWAMRERGDMPLLKLSTLPNNIILDNESWKYEITLPQTT